MAGLKLLQLILCLQYGTLDALGCGRPLLPLQLQLSAEATALGPDLDCKFLHGFSFQFFGHHFPSL